MKRNKFKAELEAFYYNLDKQTSHITSDEKDIMKSKIRRTCENYLNIPTKTQFDKVILNMSKNKNIVIMKQNKGRGVVIMDKTKYIEKCQSHLDTINFKKLPMDPTKDVEKKVQRTLLDIKKCSDEQVYKEIYPSGSNPGKFYGLAKVHKLKDEDLEDVDKLPIRPIISNIGTAT